MSQHQGGVSENISKLLEEQELIKRWLEECEKKLYILEDSYLQEFPNNIVRGWQELMEGKTPTLSDRKRQVEESERIFSSHTFLTSAARIEVAGDDSNKQNTEDGRRKKRKKEKDAVGQKDKQDAKWRKELEVDHVSEVIISVLFHIFFSLSSLLLKVLAIFDLVNI